MLFAFIPFMAHMTAAYLHGIPLLKLFPSRTESKVLKAYWWLTLLCVFYHLAFGLYRFSINMDWPEIANVFRFSHKTILAFLTPLCLPLFVQEMSRNIHSTLNPVQKALKWLVRVSGSLFWLGIMFSCLLTWVYVRVHLLGHWDLLPSFPKTIFIRGQLIFISAIGGFWVLLLVFGFRSKEGTTIVSKRPFQIFFGIMLLLAISPNLIDWEPLKTFGNILGPLSSVPFALLFAWYKFRIAFLDYILKKATTWILTIVSVFIFLSTGFCTSQNQAELGLLLISTFLLAFVLMNLVKLESSISRIWQPKLGSEKEFHDGLHATLANCTNIDQAIEQVSHYLSSHFHAQIKISLSGQQGETSSEQTVHLPGEPGVVMSLGPIKGLFPWYSTHLSLIRVAGLFLQNHLVLLKKIEEQTRIQMLNKDLESQATRAQLNALQHQIKPHFLFNALNTVHSLIGEDSEKAEQTLELLCLILRRSLENDSEQIVSLQSELDWVQAYIRIEQARFGERLQVDVPTEQDGLRYSLPSFCLQPLIENAVKYGMGQTFGVCHITIDIRFRKSNLLEISVSNHSEHAIHSGEKAGLGIALDNIRKRLKLHYGEAAQLVLETFEKGSKATLYIPQE